MKISHLHGTYYASMCEQIQLHSWFPSSQSPMGRQSVNTGERWQSITTVAGRTALSSSSSRLSRLHPNVRRGARYPLFGSVTAASHGLEPSLLFGQLTFTDALTYDNNLKQNGYKGNFFVHRK